MSMMTSQMELTLTVARLIYIYIYIYRGLIYYLFALERSELGIII